MKLLLSKVSLSNSFSLISHNFANFSILANVFLGLVCYAAMQSHSPGRRVGYRCWQAYLNISNSRIFIENPLGGKASQKKIDKKLDLEFTSMEKCTKLLLTEPIW
jgi:hypothetical protein